jgi:hypothetical protein
VATIEEDLQVLDLKLKQLRLDYEQYFLGARPREPVMLRGEVQKLVSLYSNVPIQNTAQRFKFSSLCSRYLTQRRQWDLILRKIEEGTYERHVFKANLHARSDSSPAVDAAADRASREAPASKEADLFESYLEACRSVGQETTGLTRERLARVMDQQRDALRQQYGCTEVRFRVVVEGGKAKLKATRGTVPA